MSEVLDPAIYGTAWKPMDGAPRDGSVVVSLLVPNRPEIKVVLAIRVGERWLTEAGYLPDDQPPIGWMPTPERDNSRLSIEAAKNREPPIPEVWPRKPS